jgi:hypothetical protein
MVGADAVVHAAGVYELGVNANERDLTFILWYRRLRWMPALRSLGSVHSVHLGDLDQPFAIDMLSNVVIGSADRTAAMRLSG